MAKFISDSGNWDNIVEENGSVLDKIALEILNNHQLSMPQYVCVAIFEHEDIYYVAANGLALREPETKSSIVKQGKAPRELYIVDRDGLGKMHAEMKLLWYLLENNIPLQGKEIGVSKPCCTLCAIVLNSEGVAFSMWHDKSVYWISLYPCNVITPDGKIKTGNKQSYKERGGDYYLELRYPEHFPQIENITIADIQAASCHTAG